MKKSATIHIKRIYETPDKQDGYRMLIDRVWPRGLTKEAAAIDEWNKDIAPSNDLRKWFGHIDDRFDEFAKRYQQELLAKKEELIRLKHLAAHGKLCLLYGAKNEKHNQAVVLLQILSEQK